jgi:hypothetical protein
MSLFHLFADRPGKKKKNAKGQLKIKIKFNSILIGHGNLKKKNSYFLDGGQVC